MRNIIYLWYNAVGVLYCMFDIYEVINNIKDKRKIFVSEADMQFAFAWAIKELYPEAIIRLEYCPEFDLNMHIDILVIINNEWIPIELKYKTKGCIKELDSEKFYLKNQGAKDIGCYLYLKDIERIEKVKDNINNFSKGYSIFLTNELSYTRSPKRVNTFYEQFALGDDTIKKGKLDWHLNTGSGTKKGIEKPIELKNEYHLKWNMYSKIDDTNSGIFKILVSELD